MRRRARLIGVAAVALVAASSAALAVGGGSASFGAVASKARPTYHADVEPILRGRCVACHRVGGVASPLRTYRQAFAQRTAIARTVRQRTMPPWQAARGHRAYRGDPSLTTGQVATITRWVAQGARRGNPRQRGRPLRRIAAAPMRADSTVRGPVFTPRFTAQRKEDDRCFVLAWPPRTATYISGFRVLPGTSGQIRRVNVYMLPGEIAGDLDRWEATDPGPGYDCFGGPSPLGEPPSLLVATLGANWAAGHGGTELMPAGTGIPMPPGARLVVEVHYAARGAAKPERTTLQFQLEPAAARIGFMTTIFDPSWADGSSSFRIPAGERGRTYSTRIDTGLLFDVLDRTSISVDMAYVHMQHLGTSATVRLERAGRSQVLLSIPRWRLDLQRFFWFVKPVPLRRGDAITLECRYDNTAANQPVIDGQRQAPRDVRWGFDPPDETCIGAVYVAGRPLASAAAAARRLAAAPPVLGTRPG